MLSISTFERLSATALHDYMEPLLSSDSLVVEPEAVSHLSARLRVYDDEHHLVYALILLARFKPDAVVPLLPEFLRHPEISVSCTALNILRDLPAESITPSLMQSVEELADSNLHVPEVLERLRSVIRG